jgi:hypothetical protein
MDIERIGNYQRRDSLVLLEPEVTGLEQHQAQQGGLFADGGNVKRHKALVDKVNGVGCGAAFICKGSSGVASAHRGADGKKLCLCYRAGSGLAGNHGSLDVRGCCESGDERSESEHVDDAKHTANIR